MSFTNSKLNASYAWAFFSQIFKGISLLQSERRRVGEAEKSYVNESTLLPMHENTSGNTKVLVSMIVNNFYFFNTIAHKLKSNISKIASF